MSAVPPPPLPTGSCCCGHASHPMCPTHGMTRAYCVCSAHTYKGNFIERAAFERIDGLSTRIPSASPRAWKSNSAERARSAHDDISRSTCAQVFQDTVSIICFHNVQNNIYSNGINMHCMRASGSSASSSGASRPPWPTHVHAPRHAPCITTVRTRHDARRCQFCGSLRL